MFNIFKKSSTKPVNLFFKTDIHCHLIPGIDDGAAEAAEGALLVEREKGWGIERIICTPHITEDTFENTPEIISGAFTKLKEAVCSRGTDIGLEDSAAHRLCPVLCWGLERGE